MNEMKERYIIRYGKFGAYFYDLDIKKEMTIDNVLFALNYGNEFVEKYE